MEYVLEAEHLTKRFGKKVALQDFSLKIPKGSIYGLLGPNGAGKTTFIRIINQITLPDEGRVLLNGEPLSPSHISMIGYMPEERGLYKNMKVGEQAIYLARLKGLSASDAKKKLRYWFEKLDITDWWDKKLSELSKGMGQKIQFIVTVLHEPKLLIFDEPFSGFDPVNAQIIRDQILELKQKGTTIIFSTHRMESVEEMCDYVALINQSRKVLDGDIEEVRNSFKKGLYQVTLKAFSPESIAGIQQKYDALHVLNQDKSLLTFEIVLPQKSNNSFVQELMEYGDILSFNEVIPSMNEIFINTVKSPLS